MESKKKEKIATIVGGIILFLIIVVACYMLYQANLTKGLTTDKNNSLSQDKESTKTEKMLVVSYEVSSNKVRGEVGKEDMGTHVVIRTMDEWNTWEEKYPQVFGDLGNYDAHFFEENVVIVVRPMTDSGSVQYAVTKVEKSEDGKKLNIHIQKTSSQAVTLDLVTHFMGVELKQSDVTDTTTITIINEDPIIID